MSEFLDSLQGLRIALLLLVEPLGVGDRERRDLARRHGDEMAGAQPRPRALGELDVAGDQSLLKEVHALIIRMFAPLGYSIEEVLPIAGEAKH